MRLSLSKSCPLLVALAICSSVLPGCGNNDEDKPAPVSPAPAVVQQPETVEPQIELPLIGMAETSTTERTFAELIDDLNRTGTCTDEEIRELVENVEQTPSDPLVVDAARLVFRSGRIDDVQAVGDAIINDQLDNPQVMQIIRTCYEARGGADVLSRIADQATGDLQITAKYWLALRLDDLPKAIRLMQDVANYEKQLPVGRATLQAMANGFINARLHLQIGNTAPEIEAADVHGETFKLSDYRGKVVVLDFWGDW